VDRADGTDRAPRAHPLICQGAAAAGDARRAAANASNRAARRSSAAIDAASRAVAAMDRSSLARAERSSADSVEGCNRAEREGEASGIGRGSEPFQECDLGAQKHRPTLRPTTDNIAQTMVTCGRRTVSIRQHFAYRCDGLHSRSLPLSALWRTRQSAHPRGAHTRNLPG
jgi:hypothetical protein